MAVWNIRYQAEFFSSNQACNYRIDFYKKDYTAGTINSLRLDPEIIQEWQDDDPKTPIRGCTLKIGVITNDPFYYQVHFEDFYSNEDDTWKAVLTRLDTGEILFVGYLLQDDCSELCVDYTHTFKLTFSDNLGVMKNVSILEASKVLPATDTFSSITVYSTFGKFHRIYSLDSRWGILNIGDNFTIYTGPLAGTYNVIDRGYDTLYGYWVYTAEDVPISYTLTDDIDYTYYVIGLTGYQSFKNIFQMLIYSTGIKLPLNIMTKLVPVGGTTDELLRDTFIDINSFYKNNEWMNCYDILEQICLRFNACFFQAHGQWYFVRWDELYRYTTTSGALYQGDAYDADMNPSTVTQNIVKFDFLGGKDMETGTIKSIIRPDLFVKETFNYIIQENMLCNSDLKKLGAVIREVVSGPYLLKEYELPDWYDGPYAPYATRFIRITYDNNPASTTYKEELDRNIIIIGPTGDNSHSAKSCDINFSQNDWLDYSFSFRTSLSESGPGNLYFFVELTDGSTTYKLKEDGSWVTIGGGINFSFSSSDDLIEWRQVGVKSKPAPISGVMNVYLNWTTTNPACETLYKDFSFIVHNIIDGSEKIIGHIHETEQYIVVKKSNEKEIYIDDAPRTSINGALYLNSYTNLFRDLTKTWHYPGTSYSYDKLGQGTTEEALYTSYIPRYKFEGNLIYINIDDKMLTPFSVFNLKTNDNQFRFVPGKVTINYHANMAEVTLWEYIRNSAGIEGNQVLEFFDFMINKQYFFNYLYENY